VFSIEQMRAVDPDLVEHETRQLGGAAAGEGLPEGGRALVVGHSPTSSAVSGLVGQTIAAMGTR
jgi:hypothetical protein